MDDKILHVEVMSPEKILYNGPAQAVSAINDAGKFDILPLHSHFITMIEGDLTIHTDNKKRLFPKVQGVIRCFDNDVKIYLETESKESQ